MGYKELKPVTSWRTFELEGEPELIHIKQIRDEEYMVVHEDAYDSRTGEVELFFSKEHLELTFNIKI